MIEMFIIAEIEKKGSLFNFCKRDLIEQTLKMKKFHLKGIFYLVFG